MAPIRRYLRISRYSVLETRIYLEQPGQAQSWLVGGRDPALPRIIAAIRNLVREKLREENEWARTNGKPVSKKASAAKTAAGKKIGERDVIVDGTNKPISHNCFD